MKLFISLGQPDGRLVPGEQYPFPDNIHHAMFSIFQLEPDEQVPMKFFDRKRQPRPKLSTIKEYRELSMSLELKEGRYILVPSCKKPNETGDYYLSIYFSEGEEDHSDGKDDVFKWFEAKYINPPKLEEKDHLEGYVIKEEDEDGVIFDEKFKKVLSIKSKHVIWNDDEDQDKPYIADNAK